ncbi:MAG: replication-associated recombination protein A, partial [Catonella sp.]|nr:replication-associated recombination protein A [Catonella sp.]
MEQMTFGDMMGNGGNSTVPLADRLRPEDLSDFAGQEHLLGPGKLLRRLIENDEISSMI